MSDPAPRRRFRFSLRSLILLERFADCCSGQSAEWPTAATAAELPILRILHTNLQKALIVLISAATGLWYRWEPWVRGPVLEGHSHFVWSAAYSPDDQR